jgi:uncharacterized Fe-S cluster-containing radical SAM superfamily protein
MEIKGKAMKSPDGSFDSYEEQKTHYGITVADAFCELSCNSCWSPPRAVGLPVGLLRPGTVQLLVSLDKHCN